MPVPPHVLEIREIIGNDLLMMVAASAVILREDGHILLQKRRDNGMWGLPGGAIEPGEEPALAVMREALEETGLHVLPRRITGVYSDDLHIHYPNGDEVAFISIGFVCDYISGTPRVDDDETAALRWYAPDQLPENFVPFHRIRIAHALEEGAPFYTPADAAPPPLVNDYIGALRARVGTRMLQLAGTSGIVQRDDGRILLQQRADTGEWGVPGGIIEPGEAPAAAAVREVREETGYVVRPLRLTGVYGGEKLIVNYDNGDIVAYVGVMFLCEWVDGEAGGDPAETRAVEWVDPQQLPDNIIPIHREFIHHALTCDTPFFRLDDST